MTIDLDDLENRVRLVEALELSAMTIQPSVVLGLIARVRELEMALSDIIE